MVALASVPRCWPGATIVCIGSGPSLQQDDLLRVQRAAVRTLVINDALRLAPWAEVHYAPDDRWWGWHGDWAQRVGVPYQYTLSPRVALAWPPVQALNYRSGVQVSDDPGLLYTGGHAGFQAPQIARHFGAARIVLLGYDAQPDDNGRHHFFGDHPDGTHVPYAQWRAVYGVLHEELAARGVALVNASRSTAITAVPRVSLEEALSAIRSTG